MLMERLAETPWLSSLDAPDARLIKSVRHWVFAAKSGQCRIAALTARLGCGRTAAHLHLLLDEIGAAWPDPFCVAPPCCGRLSHDEATLSNMLATAAEGDRAAFDRLLSDLLPADVRERLYLSVTVLQRLL